MSYKRLFYGSDLSNFRAIGIENLLINPAHPTVVTLFERRSYLGAFVSVLMVVLLAAGSGDNASAEP